jgi:hypothetical protein
MIEASWNLGVNGMSQSTLHVISLVIRWAARVVGTLLVALFIFMLVGYSLSGDFFPIFHLNTVETLETIAVLMSLTGVGIAWRWELPGGLMVLAGGLFFNLVESIDRGNLDPVWFATVFMVVGVLFVLAWYLAGRQQAELVRQ